MSPVKQSSNRSVLLAVGGVAVAVVGLGLLLLFVFAVQSGTESGKVEVKLGEETFDAGSARQRAQAIAEGGPILFSDVSSGQRDVFLQHIGDDPDKGWWAFDARKPDATRDCTLRWDAGQGQFTDPCDGSVVPADGTGLRQYQIQVTEGGEVVIDLNKPRQ